MRTRIIEAGAVALAEIESVIGRLSCARTSIFGRIGEAILAPLYAKLHYKTYRPLVPPNEITTLSCWTVALARVEPRRIRQRHPAPERIAYTDSTGKSQFTAVAALTPGTIDASDTRDSILSSKTDRGRGKTFGEIFYIYGLEMLEVLATPWQKTMDSMVGQ